MTSALADGGSLPDPVQDQPVRADDDPGATPSEPTVDEADAWWRKVVPYGWWVLGLGLFVAAAILPALRQTGFRSWQTIWSEDGPIYITQGEQHGYGAVLFRGYAGYLQLAPRVLVAPMGWVPVSRFAQYTTFVGGIFNALVAAYLFRTTRGRLGSVWCRIALCAVLVLGASLFFETTGNLTNVIWILLAALPWTIASTAERRVDVALRCGVGALTALSTILAALFAPAAIAYMLWRRTRAATLVCSSFLVALALQGAVALRAAEDVGRAESKASDLATLYPLKVVGSYLVGDRPISELWIDHGKVVAVVVVLLLGAVLVACSIGASRESKVLAALAVAYSIVIYCVPMMMRGTGIARITPDSFTFGAARFVGPAVVLLASAVLLLIDSPDRTRERTVARIARPLFVVQTAVVCAASFAMPNMRTTGPAWFSELQLARQECLDGGVTQQDVRVSPSPGRAPLFTVTLTCDRILADAP